MREKCPRPRWAILKPTWVRWNTNWVLHPRRKCCRSGLRQHLTQRLCARWYQKGAQEACLCAVQPLGVLRQTQLQETARRDIHANGLVALHGEILVSPCTKGTLHTTPHLQDASKSPTPDMARALPERPLGLAIGFPIDKKENVTRLFLHDRLELLDEHCWEKTRISGNGKQSKSKKSVKTLAVSQAH